MCFLTHLTKDLLELLLLHKVSKSTLFGINPAKKTLLENFAKENEP